MARKPAFVVTLNRGEQVLPTSKALGEGSPFAEVLGRCNSRLEISTWPGLGEIKDGQTTLTTLHAALMDETRGILYTIRNKALSGPKSGLLVFRSRAPPFRPSLEVLGNPSMTTHEVLSCWGPRSATRATHASVSRT